MSYFSKNLKFLRQKRGETQYTFAPLLDIKRTSYANYEQENAEPPIKLLIAIANLFNISIDDLINKELNDQNYIQYQNQDQDNSENENNIVITAGNLLLPLEAQKNYLQQKRHLKNIYLPNIDGDARTIEVNDDGMYDSLEEGDFVVCIPSNLQSIKSGLMYAIILEDKIMIRQIKQRQEGLILIPKNKAYATINIPISEVKEIWEVSMRLTKSLVTI